MIAPTFMDLSIKKDISFQDMRMELSICFESFFDVVGGNDGCEHG